MKCFLHIGTEKTATTTIQNFFDTNRDALLEKGFIYTKAAGRFNNRALSVAAYNLSKRDGYTKSHLIDTEEKLLDFQRKTIQKLKKEIEAIATDANTLIFSSEHFQSRLTQLEEIERLRDILYDLGASEISVVVYLRRPADIANSLYSTGIKSGGFSEEPPSPKNPYWSNVCNHKNTLEKFSNVFGESAIIPRLFDKNEFINNSIIDDILNAMSIPNDGSYKIPDNKNESISLLGVNLLKRINKIIPIWIDNKPNQLRKNLVSYFEKHFAEGKYVMPRHLYEAYDLEFQASNNWVREKYFPNKESIFAKDIPKDVTLNVADADLDTIANLIASIWNDKNQHS